MAKKAKPFSKRKKKLIALKISVKARQRSNLKQLDKLKGRTDLTAKEKEKRSNLLWQGVQLNGVLNETQKKLNKIVKHPLKDKDRDVLKPDFDYDVQVYFRISDKAKCEDFVFEELNELNNLKRLKDAEKIQALINYWWSKMASKDVVQIRYDEAGTGYGNIMDGEEIDDDEFDIM